MASRISAGKLTAMKSRTLGGVGQQLQCNVREPMLATDAQGLSTNARVVQLRHTAIGNEDRESVVHLDTALDPDLSQRRLQPGRAHSLVTPPSTLREPERNPERSITTRVNPAESTASRRARRAGGPSQLSSSVRESSTRATSPW